MTPPLSTRLGERRHCHRPSTHPVTLFPGLLPFSAEGNVDRGVAMGWPISGVVLPTAFSEGQDVSSNVTLSQCRRLGGICRWTCTQLDPRLQSPCACLGSFRLTCWSLHFHRHLSHTFSALGPVLDTGRKAVNKSLLKGS